MTEEQWDPIQTELWDSTGYLIDIVPDVGEMYGGGFGIRIFFNDMFGWALSYIMSFVPKTNDTIDSCIKDFQTWVEFEGSDFIKRFDAVKVPKRGSNSYGDDIDNYFKENIKVGIDIEASINKYCGYNLNTDLKLF